MIRASSACARRAMTSSIITSSMPSPSCGRGNAVLGVMRKQLASSSFASSSASAYEDGANSVASGGNNDSRFSIAGTFREGRASYLDTSATTPMDPRVLDKMMPYMVSFRFVRTTRVHAAYITSTSLRRVLFFAFSRFLSVCLSLLLILSSSCIFDVRRLVTITMLTHQNQSSRSDPTAIPTPERTPTDGNPKPSSRLPDRRWRIS